MSRRKIFRLFGFLIFCGLVLGGWLAYQKIFKPLKLNKGYTYIFIETGDNLDNLMDELEDKEILQERKTFEWLAKKMDLKENINSGKYRINNGMNLRQIINLIKYKKEEKIKLTYNSQIHNLEEFITYTADKLEMNESELEELLSDESLLSEYFGLDPDNAFALITPGILETSWSINVNDFIKLFKNRFNDVWNASRKKKAKQMNMQIAEIITLASIVQGESGISSEQQKIAGVYLNRLKKGMLLQADPTLKFANKKWDAVRIYDGDKEINSPYNTYKVKGLPPGPISLVKVQAIDAVLNYTKHNYIFFCAKPELNGYSDFSSSYDQHMKFAAAYQRAMNKKGIK
ncbi:MAG: endolytic transglycosylase MltG [Sphingobacteriaceae bacterium]|nr:endolytic transglycosylase MltG [Sphingobacteriaceae bacterium]